MHQHSILFNRLVEVKKRFHPISSAYVLQMAQFSHIKFYKAGETILNFKEIQSFVWFQGSGTTMEITRDLISGKEFTTWFWFPDDFLYTEPGFFSQHPSVSSIVALEDSIFMYISVEDFLTLKQLFSETEKVSEKLRDNYKMRRTQHTLDMKHIAIERIRSFHSTHPALFKVCSRKRLASFLGMSPDTLTREMKKLGIENQNIR